MRACVRPVPAKCLDSVSVENLSKSVSVDMLSLDMSIDTEVHSFELVSYLVVRAHARMCACVHARMRACVRACACACVHACVHACVPVCRLGVARVVVDPRAGN